MQLRDVVITGMVASFLTSAAASLVHWLLLPETSRTAVRLLWQFAVSYGAAVVVVVCVFPVVMPALARWLKSQRRLADESLPAR